VLSALSICRNDPQISYVSRRVDLITENWIVFEEFFAVKLPWLGGAKDHEGIQTLRRAEGVHSEAGRRRRPCGRYLLQGRDQPSDLLNWKKKCDGMLPPDMRRLKQLKDENAKLRKLVADLSPNREMLQDVIRRKL
jgi:hypothetical protein